MTLFDQDNKILLSSNDFLDLKITKHIDFGREFIPKVERSIENAVAWKGFKFGVSVYTQGALQIDPLFDRIKFSFDHTSLDYALESYYREAKWHSLNILLQNADKHITFENSHKLAFVLPTIPKLLKEGSDSANPLVQNLTIQSQLPLGTILREIHEILTLERLGRYLVNVF